EPLVGAPDLPAYARSRLPGVLGLSSPVPGMRPSIGWPIGQTVAAFREIRDLLPTPDTILLTDQVRSGDDESWDALEELDSTTGNAVIYAYQHLRGSPRMLVRPRGLRSDVSYEVRSIDTGVLGAMMGDQLMAAGIEVIQGAGS